MFSDSKLVSQKFPQFQRIAAAVAAALLVACDGGLGQAKKAPEDVAPRVSVAAQPAPLAWYKGEQPILRFQMDAARERGWVLIRTGVLVHDFRSGQTLQHISLPGWHWAGAPFGTSPDLALGPAGDALITSDILPVLWRIDAVTMRVSRHELALNEDGDKDVGFSALAFSTRHGAYFAASPLHGTLWRIDPLLRRAQKISLSEPLAGVGALSVASRAALRRDIRLPGLCAHSVEGDRAIDLAPDQRSGYVRAQSCLG